MLDDAVEQEDAMKLDAIKLGLATTIVFAIAWVICSALVMLTPSAMMQMSGHMLHADLGDLRWTMHWTGILVGLILWSVMAGVLAWATASVYNRLIG